MDMEKEGAEVEGGKRGFHRNSSESQDERDRRNAYRKNHYLNRGKSHHQLKKDKKGAPGGPGAAAL